MSDAGNMCADRLKAKFAAKATALNACLAIQTLVECAL